jgi:Cu-processing system permease protein
MNTLLSLPITRTEIIIGKFIGLSAVMAFSIIVGFGIAGGIIALNVHNVNFGEYGIFIGATILIGIVFVSFALLLSSFFKKRSTTIAGAIFFWAFFVFIFGLIMEGILSLTVYAGVDMEKVLQGLIHITIPDWYYGLTLLNPISAYSALVGLNVGPVAASIQQNPTGIDLTYPGFYSTGLMVLILVAWIVLFLICAIMVFRRRDI